MLRLSQVVHIVTILFHSAGPLVALSFGSQRWRMTINMRFMKLKCLNNERNIWYEYVATRKMTSGCDDESPGS